MIFVFVAMACDIRNLDTVDIASGKNREKRTESSLVGYGSTSGSTCVLIEIKRTHMYAFSGVSGRRVEC